MKLRQAIFFIITTTLLTACNFTLAADVTPPPDYVPPTPMATLGPLYPVNAPDINNGASIYMEKCAPCHGNSGLGDGEQGKQLPVPVAALALPETALKASPSSWFTTVTRGNLDRFMPPFTSLSDQERWDVISYALTLHTTPEQIANGKNLFEANCSDCASKFTDLKMMSVLSDDDLVRIIKNGEGDIPAFGSKFTDEEAYAVAAYLRTLTFAIPATPTPAPTEQTSSTPGETPSTNTSGKGTVNGSIDNKTGSVLPGDLQVTLVGYEHGTDANATPQEVSRVNSVINTDGSFAFTDADIPENRIYRAEVLLDGVTYKSQFGIVKAGDASLTLPPIDVYSATEDYSLLRMDALQIYFDFANEQNVQILAVYSFANPTDKTIVLRLNGSNNIPFIKMPNNTASIGYQASPDSAPFIELSDGFAMPPSDTSYGLIAFASIPKQNTIKIEQPVILPVDQVMLLVPDGVTAEGDTLTFGGPHQFEGGNFNLYTSTRVEANGSVSFTLSGQPKNTSVSPDITQNQNLIVAGLVFGIALIIVGAWMYLRDRKRVTELDNGNAESEDQDSIMDSIIALDELHRAGKLSDEAYKNRRDELKAKLKRKS